ncbi:MAG: capsule biosynthesis protein [Methylovirgula sp.]
MQTLDAPPPLIEEIELTPLESRGSLVRYSDDLPERQRSPIWRCYNDIVFLVGLPVAIAFIYFFIIAANYYVSEAEFVVRMNSSGSVGGLSSLIQSQGLSRATDETYVVNEFARSRDMVRLLVNHDHLRALFDRPESDFITRFPNFYSKNDFEQLYRHYQNWVKVELDEGTGITTLQTEGYRPADAQALLSALLKHSEELINRLNTRAHEDALRYATLFVEKARAKVADVEARLTEFRNANGTVDPARESVVALEAIGKMNTQLAWLQTTLKQHITTTPSSPNIGPLRQRISSYHSEIEKLQHQVVGNKNSIATSLATYEGLILERSLAAKSLEAAVANLEKARQEAQQQHIYLERITQPDLPDSPERTRRLLSFLAVVAISTGIWSIIRSLRRSTREHTT